MVEPDGFFAPAETPSGGYSLQNDIGNDHNLRDAAYWEAEQGYGIEEYTEEDKRVFHYAYRDMKDAPEHHHVIARMIIRGLPEDEIAAQRRCSIQTIRRIMSHYPVRQFITRYLGKVKLAKAEVQAAAEKEKGDTAKAAFDTLGRIIRLDEEIKPSPALVKALEIGMRMDPSERYAPPKEEKVVESQFDTDSLNKFLERHKRKVVKHQEIPASEEVVDITSRKNDDFVVEETQVGHSTPVD